MCLAPSLFQLFIRSMNTEYLCCKIWLWVKICVSPLKQTGFSKEKFSQKVLFPNKNLRQKQKKTHPPVGSASGPTVSKPVAYGCGLLPVARLPALLCRFLGRLGQGSLGGLGRLVVCLASLFWECGFGRWCVFFVFFEIFVVFYRVWRCLYQVLWWFGVSWKWFLTNCCDVWNGFMRHSSSFRAARIGLFCLLWFLLWCFYRGEFKNINGVNRGLRMSIESIGWGWFFCLQRPFKKKNKEDLRNDFIHSRCKCATRKHEDNNKAFICSDISSVVLAKCCKLMLSCA